MLAFKTLRPLLNRVVVKKAVAETKTKAGIILSSGKNTEKLSFGKVISVGPGKSNDDGTIRAPLVQVGDTVLLPEYGGSKVTLAGEEDFFIYRDDDIMGTLHDPSE